MSVIDFSQGAVNSEDELREIAGVPHEFVVKKTIPIIDDHCKNFIVMSPLLFLATSNAEGKCDVSPRGDKPSSVAILNKHQLVIPDRPGNRRLDSIMNILSNPQIGLIFLIPGLDEVLRINGKATIIKNPEILNKLSLKDRPPSLGIGVDVEECFIHCPRALKKSKVWEPESWQDSEAMPSVEEIFHAALRLNGVEIKK